MPRSRLDSQRSSTPPPAGSPDRAQISCLPAAPARTKWRMTSSAHPIAQGQLVPFPLARRGARRLLVRAPGRRGALTPEEATRLLSDQRAELRTALARRHDARGLSEGERDEVLNDAIATVVMSQRPIEHEQHLQGAFWASVGFLLTRRRTGSHDLRVGSQRRVDFEPLERELPDEGEPFDVVAARDRITRAGDFIAQLDDLERQVLTVMAAYGLGVKATAKALDLPIKTVLAAARSGERKLEHVAAIAAAGRMCGYRQHSIRAHAEGTALEQESRVAKAHLAACGSCRAEHVQLLREMSSREFRRAASAALLPAPVALPEAHGWVERLLSVFPGTHGPAGSATAERAGVLLGGGKVAVLAYAAVVASVGLGVRVIAFPPAHQHARHHQAVERRRPRAAPSTYREPVAHTLVARPRLLAMPASAHPRSARTSPRAPSRDLRYLEIGGPAEGSARPAAHSASALPIPENSHPPDPPSGGRTSLDYLGR